jgi:ABC-type iron transport system FetAB permease component
MRISLKTLVAMLASFPAIIAALIMALLSSFRASAHQPPETIALLRMAQGNTKISITLGLIALNTGAIHDTNFTAARLALRDKISTATSGFVQKALKTGLISIIKRWQQLELFLSKA